jgi:hypothetical protein
MLQSMLKNRLRLRRSTLPRLSLLAKDTLLIEAGR